MQARCRFMQDDPHLTGLETLANPVRCGKSGGLCGWVAYPGNCPDYAIPPDYCDTALLLQTAIQAGIPVFMKDNLVWPLPVPLQLLQANPERRQEFPA